LISRALQTAHPADGTRPRAGWWVGHDVSNRHVRNSEKSKYTQQSATRGVNTLLRVVHMPFV
jgi:hypothetical protein